MSDQHDSSTPLAQVERTVKPAWPSALLAWAAWTLTTTLGWAFGTVISAAATFSSGIWDPDEVQAYLRRSPWDRLLDTLLAGAIIGLVLGVVIGLVQILVLRSRTRDALVSALAIMVGSALLCSVSAGGPAQIEGPFVTSLRTGLVGGAVGGGFVALCQHLILRRRLTATNGWVWVTLVAWTAGWASGWIAIDTFSALSAPYTRGMPLTAVGMPLTFVIGVMAGALVGLAQWVILRRHVKQAGWWMAATAGSWGLAFVSIAAGVGLMYRGVIVGGVTGAALVWLTSPRATSADCAATE
jgi:uncharacterized integral membrane protein